jgi:hypothetical protein
MKTDSGLEHLIASMQPNKHSKDYPTHSTDSEDGQPAPEAPKVLVCASRSPEVLEVPDGRLQKHSTPAGLDYEELGGLSDLGQRDCPRAQNVLE